MILAGADPERLTLREFLDAGFALLVEEYVRLGSTVNEAIGRINAPAVVAEGVDVPAVQQNAHVEAIDNDAAFSDLMSQISGIPGVR